VRLRPMQPDDLEPVKAVSKDAFDDPRKRSRWAAASDSTRRCSTGTSASACASSSRSRGRNAAWLGQPSKYNNSTFMMTRVAWPARTAVAGQSWQGEQMAWLWVHQAEFRAVADA
jgi:hypothetical protein